MDYIFCRCKYTHREITNRSKVVLLNLKLPKVNGLEVLRAIKADDWAHTIPIVIITSSRQGHDIETAYEYGANSYVVKPVDFNTFAEAMSQLGLYWILINQVSRL